jgi:CxxC motif-containing protein
MSLTFTHYLCIGCPLGCRLEVEEEEGAIVEVRGFACKRGEEYALQEHSDPRRMVTASVRVRNGLWARLPVRTTVTVPKNQVRAVCQLLRRISATAPIRMGEVVVANVLGTGVDVVASRDMPEGDGLGSTLQPG